jgi:hypothetical protein
MRKLLFSLDRLEFAGNAEVFIAGRCCSDDIKEGDKAQFMAFQEDDGSMKRHEEVSIVFKGFVMYGKLVDTVYSGYTVQRAVLYSSGKEYSPPDSSVGFHAGHQVESRRDDRSEG